MAKETLKRILSSLTVEKVGKKVKISGWAQSIRDHGQLIFIDLRDWSGRVQVVINPENKELFKQAKEVGTEYVIEIIGEVREREEKLKNKKIETGEIEIVASELTILNKSKPLPFGIDTDGREIDENVRLKYRYVDLRRDRLKTNMIKRHKFLQAVRNWMTDNGFLEVTTPLLTTTSPEGARDFMVPSRIHPGKVYVLPQAPQQFKQLLMVSGVDRYFQIAPCLRDEDPRADRHYGVFYQIDMEMSFPTQEELFKITQELIINTYKEVSPKKELVTEDFPLIPYHESMDKYGTDKPDVRFEMELQNITELVKDKTEFNIFNSAELVKCVVAQGAGEWSRKEIGSMDEFAKSHGAQGLAYTKVTKTGLESGISKFIEPVAKEIIKAIGAKDGDLIFFGAGEVGSVNNILGKVREELGERLGLRDPNKLAFVWITEFPFYVKDEKTGKLDFGHNPFSMPRGGIKAFETDDPLSIATDQYDLAVNGYEVLSGSIRNHDPEVLIKAFETVGYDKEEVLKRFGGMYNAFQYGAPPHGGWAIGIDRLFMVLIDESNIRDVYAFPKSSSGVDMMMDAPSTPRQEDMDILGIQFRDKGVQTVNSIKSLLNVAGVKYELMEHEEVQTSEQAAQVRGTQLSDGAKAMVLQSKEYDQKLILVVIPADKQLDLDKVAKIIGEEVRIASPELMEKKLGLQVGAVSPFGRLLGMEVYFDKSLYTKKTSAFNIGVKTQSIVMKSSDLIKLAQPNKLSQDSEFTS